MKKLILTAALGCTFLALTTAARADYPLANVPANTPANGSGSWVRTKPPTCGKPSYQGNSTIVSKPNCQPNLPLVSKPNCQPNLPQVSKPNFPISTKPGLRPNDPVMLKPGFAPNTPVSGKPSYQGNLQTMPKPMAPSISVSVQTGGQQQKKQFAAVPQSQQVRQAGQQQARQTFPQQP